MHWIFESEANFSSECGDCQQSSSRSPPYMRMERKKWHSTTSDLLSKLAWTDARDCQVVHRRVYRVADFAGSRKLRLSRCRFRYGSPTSKAGCHDVHEESMAKYGLTSEAVAREMPEGAFTQDACWGTLPCQTRVSLMPSRLSGTTCDAPRRCMRRCASSTIPTDCGDTDRTEVTIKRCYP